MVPADARTSDARGEGGERTWWTAAGLAHDLNNVLTCMLADMEVLEEGLSAARRLARGAGSLQALELARAVDGCADWVTGLRENLDAAARYGRELTAALHAAPAAAPGRGTSELAAAVHRSLRASAADLRGTQVTVFVEPVLVAAPADAIIRILANLLRNAAEAFAADAADRRVEVRTHVGEDVVTCDVRDNGPGVPRAFLPRLFERSATTKPSARGSGVGLASSRALAREAGGDLTLVETGAEGTTFRLVLPRAS